MGLQPFKGFNTIIHIKIIVNKMYLFVNNFAFAFISTVQGAFEVIC